MSYLDEVTRVVRRESACKQRILANLHALGLAMDVAELSSADLARHALKSLGLQLASDPVEALDFYVAGLKHRAGRFAQDSVAGSLADKLDKHFNS